MVSEIFVSDSFFLKRKVSSVYIMPIKLVEREVRITYS